MGELKLNVGCGQFKADGWVNADIDPDHEPDVIWDCRWGAPMRFAHGMLSAIYAGHVLEHVTIEQVPSVLDTFANMLKRGGDLFIVGPDYVGAHQAGFGQDVLDGIVLGPSDEDPHLWVCSAEALMLGLLCHRKWTDIELVVRMEDYPVGEWPDGPLASRVGWQCGIVARRKS